MADIVNLRQRRKAAAQKAARAAADENSARFGRTAAERAADKAQAGKSARDLDGHKRDPDGDTLT